jgi:hypothetical protein
MAIFPIKDFFLEGFWQNSLAWSSLILFMGVPIIALITWLVRRIMGVKSTNNYLGYTFGGLWVIGLFSFIFLAGLMARNFKNRAGVEDTVTINQPSKDKLYVEAVGNNIRYYGDDWFGIEWDEDAPFYGINRDSLMLKTVRVNVVKSNDSNYHVYTIRFSRSNTNNKARELAEHIKFPINQQDSVLQLPKGFVITADDKFRNQQVLVVVEVPIGKKIEIDRSVEDFDWFNVNMNRRRGFNVSWDNNWDDSFSWDNNIEYIMTRDGLKRTNENTEKEIKEGKFKIESDGVIIEGQIKDGEKKYEYKGPDKNQPEKKDTIKVKAEASIVKEDESSAGFLPSVKSLPSLPATDLDASPLVILTSLLR